MRQNKLKDILFPLTIGICLCAILSVPSVAQIKSDTLSNVDVVALEANKQIVSTAPQYGISSDDVLKLGVTDIADALHRLPGVTLRDYGGAGGMKTASVRGLGSQNTGVSYDGIALSNTQTGQIDLMRYSLNNVHSLQLYIGDNEDIFQPARNVANASLLAIKTFAKQPKEFHYKGNLSYGSWNYWNPMLQMEGKLTERLSMNGIVDYIHADNDYPFTLINVKQKTRERRINSDMDQWHGEMNVYYQLGQQNTLSAKLYYYDNDRKLPGIVHYYTNVNDEALHERNAFAQMHWNWTIDDKWAVQGNGKWNWSTSDYHNGIPSGGITSAEYWQREYYCSGAVLYSPTHWISLDYSADYFLNNLNSSLATDTKPSRHSVLQSLSAKTRYQGLTFMVRGIYSLYINNNEDAEAGKNVNRLSPSVSASYRPFDNEQFYVRASWKSIFRMPTFNELYYYHLGNNDLSPERTSQLNVGLTWQKTLSPISYAITLDGYINDVKDKIVSIPVNMFVWRTLNIAKVRAYGLDATADIQYALTKKHTLGLTGNYSLNRAENRAFEGEYYGHQIAYTPLHSGSATLSWTNPWVNLSVTADGMSSRWATNEHTANTDINGFVEFGASLYRTFYIKRIALAARASVLNMFDRQYDIVAHYPMPGRSFRISVTVEK